VFVYYNGQRSGIAPVSAPIAGHCCVFSNLIGGLDARLIQSTAADINTRKRQTKQEMEHREDEMDIEFAAIDLHTNNTKSKLIQQAGTN